MITQENEFYLRFILLLIQGGTEVLREIAAKALQKCNTTLDQFLSKNASAIQKTRDLTKKQKDILYPVSPTAVSDIRDYDITLLSYLIINFLSGSLDCNESNAVYKIRQMRNDYHAHKNEAKMNISTFNKEWSTLMRIMFTISHNLPEERRVNLTKIMDSIEHEQLDIKVVIDEIKKLDQSNEYLNVLQSMQMSLDDLSQTVTAAYSNSQKERDGGRHTAMADTMADAMADSMANDMADKMADSMANDMADTMADAMADSMDNDMDDTMADAMADSMANDMDDTMADDMADSMANEIANAIAKDIADAIAKDIADAMAKDMAMDMSKRYMHQRPLRDRHARE